MRHLASLATLFALAALISACSPAPGPAFLWCSEEHYWRIDGEHDVVEWIEIEHGLTSPSAHAVEQLSAVLASARVFPPNGGWLSLSLDEPAPPPTAEAEDFERAVSELAPTVRVVDVHVVRDQDDHPSLWRRVRIEHASAWLLAFQDELFQHVDDARPDSTFALPGDLELDAPSLTLLRAELRKGLEVWRLEGKSLVMEVPMTEQRAHDWMRAQTFEASTPRTRPPAELSFADGRLRVRHLPDESGWVVADPYDMPPRDYEPGFEACLASSRLCVEPNEAYGALRRAAGLR